MAYDKCIAPTTPKHMTPIPDRTVFMSTIVGVSYAFKGWVLRNAVRKGLVEKVQRLATPQLFENLAPTLGAAIMAIACQKTSAMKPAPQSQAILEHLLNNGGVLSKQCLQKKWDGEPSLGLLGYKWMQLAVNNNAVHDNLKYTMLREGIHDHKTNANLYGHELSESIVAKWPEHFIQHQFHFPDRNKLWHRVTEKGSDKLLRLFIEITPQEYINIDYLRYLHKRDDYPTPLSVETLEALHNKGFAIERLMRLWITGSETSTMTRGDLEGYLDRNPTLVKNIKQFEETLIVAEQRQRLLEEVGGTAKPQIATRRKM